ncbi:flavodoxin [Rhizobium sp. GN54]|uniref:flavodoxin n=1 Tax=Rhizobium sp. GN54 TaxID=2898150 RepID=UPI001E3C178B|nr:flavodoxin [Rhizobium sp. GN54]MCD2182922.1 flavodoxin [Rhizobium sp. GN54]
MQGGIARRDLLKAVPLAAAGLMAVAGEAASGNGADSGRTLVACFSRTGNTRVVARQIGRARAASPFEIEAATPYPEDYEETVAQARRETATGTLPGLAHFVADVRRYDTIYLGFPIWGMTAPPVIRSFLRAHDLSGKVVHPFVTHGGYGLGDSLEVVGLLAQRADIRPVFAMEADQERRTLERVTGWLAG